MSEKIRDEIALQSEICSGRYISRKNLWGATIAIVSIIIGLIVASISYAVQIGQAVAIHEQRDVEHERRLSSIDDAIKVLDRIEHKIDRLK